MSFVGTGVGAINRSNRAAYKRRANLNSQLKPCRSNCITKADQVIVGSIVPGETLIEEGYVIPEADTTTSCPVYSADGEGTRELTSLTALPSGGTIIATIHFTGAQGSNNYIVDVTPHSSNPTTTSMTAEYDPPVTLPQPHPNNYILFQKSFSGHPLYIKPSIATEIGGALSNTSAANSLKDSSLASLATITPGLGLISSCDLPTGYYTYYCSFHPANMRGYIIVL